jgi:hypothetical protein
MLRRGLAKLDVQHGRGPDALKPRIGAAATHTVDDGLVERLGFDID